MPKISKPKHSPLQLRRGLNGQHLVPFEKGGGAKATLYT